RRSDGVTSLDQSPIGIPRRGTTLVVGVSCDTQIWTKSQSCAEKLIGAAYPLWPGTMRGVCGGEQGFDRNGLETIMDIRVSDFGLASRQNSGAWRGFLPGAWQSRVNVREFIQRNYTPYEGDDSFLAAPTER